MSIPESLLHEFIAAADPAGFVPLKIFSQKILKRTVNEISTFFDSEGRFYSKYQNTVLHDIRHNVRFLKKYKRDGSLRERVCEGGVHEHDLQRFIAQAQAEIEENNKNFEVAYKKHYGLDEPA